MSKVNVGGNAANLTFTFAACPFAVRGKPTIWQLPNREANTGFLLFTESSHSRIVMSCALLSHLMPTRFMKHERQIILPSRSKNIMFSFFSERVKGSSKSRSSG